MGPVRNSHKNDDNKSLAVKLRENFQYFFHNFTWKKLLTFEIFHNEQYYGLISNSLLIFELLLNVIIIHRVKYTEIDWSTYMQQVECFLNGTTDYSLIRGDTGPIVYPAGHLYVYTVLYYLTNYGRNIYRAQFIFASIYLLQLFLVFQLYRNHSLRIPPYILIFMCLTSYRIHSIYLLRLFNDPIAILFLYLSLLMFNKQKWTIGSLLFSLAVSIKMNILLFAPGLFILYNEFLTKWNVFKNLFICAIVQIIIAIPFIATYPISYLRYSFNFERIFEHKWTVNYRFLSESIFVHKGFHLFLIICHISMLVIVFRRRLLKIMKNLMNFNHNKNDDNEHENVIANMMNDGGGDDVNDLNSVKQKKLIGQYILMTMFISNFIGICFARSLHYQFYIWYHHSLPYMLYTTASSIKYSMINIFLLGLIELVWNIYPSTQWSSIILHLVHLIILYRCYKWSLVNLNYFKYF